MLAKMPELSSSANVAQPATVALFISDLHLQASMPRTTQAFLAFLREHGMKTRELYLLGDLFEYWAGDDDIAAPSNQQVIDAIRAVSDAGVKVFWIAGNRDFLVGDVFAAATGATLLPDPFIATIAGRRLVLAHGDAQCTDDLAYMTFRAQVRDPDWQRKFLAQPLARRKEIIEGLRAGSREAQRRKSMDIMDVNGAAVAALFDESQSSIMIHGHTHRPALHATSAGDASRERFVLPDWDCDTEPRRGGWIAIDSEGVIRRYGVDGSVVS
jgi:UDP-2,3-diacylglucosamine hydrolase